MRSSTVTQTEVTMVRAFGYLVRERRREAHLSQEKLASAAGTHAPTISKLETGKEMPSANIIRNICKILDIPEDAYMETNTIDDVIQSLKKCEELPGEIIAAVITIISAWKEE